MGLRLYALAAVALLVLALFGWGAWERGSRIAAAARADALAGELAQVRADLAAERDAAQRADRLAQQQAAAAASARARADAIERTTRDLIETFRADEVSAPEPTTEPETETNAPTPPRAACSCRFSPGELDRLRRDIPVRRPPARADTSDGQLRGESMSRP